MAVPPPIKTAQEIKGMLDAENNGNWIIMPDYYGVTSVSPTSYSLDFSRGEKGIVLTAFLNTSTAEVRFYIAKFLDIPERGNLFPPEP